MVQDGMMAGTVVLDAPLSRVLLGVKAAETRPGSVHDASHKSGNNLRVTSGPTWLGSVALADDPDDIRHGPTAPGHLF